MENNYSQSLIYNQKNGKIQIINKKQVCILLKSYKLKESMTYEEIAKKCQFNIVDKGIYNFKNQNTNKLIFLIDKTLDEFKSFLKKNKLPISDNFITLYHGSKSGLKLPIQVDYSDKNCDFGQGFYIYFWKNKWCQV